MGSSSERVSGHYRAGLNAVPVLAEFKRNPDAMYLIRCVACSPGAEGRGWPRRPGVDLVEPSFDEPIAVDLLQPHHASGSGCVIAMQRDPSSGAWMNVDLRNIW